MNSRMAQIITDAMDQHGTVDRQKVFKSLLVSPEDPTALVIDACLFLQDVPKDVRESSKLLRDDLEKFIAVRSETIGILEQTRKIAEHTSLDNKSAVQSIATTIKSTLDSLDLQQLSNKLSNELETGTLTPYKRSVEQLLQGTDQLKNATDAADLAVAAWRKIHLKTVVVVSAVFWLLIFGAGFLYSWQALQRHYKNQFIAAMATHRRTLTDNLKAFRELSALGVSVTVERAVDQTGRNVPGRYCLITDEAIETRVWTENGRKKGVIHFAGRFDEALSQQIRDFARTRDLADELKREVEEIEARRKENLR